ncbi:MAG: hypothetical protein V3T62_05480, partial [Alphaproteobacteria bacterium]
MARGMKPINRPDRSAWPSGDDALSHIIGISMDAKGMPIRLFTTNRWVTGEAWYKARDVSVAAWEKQNPGQDVFEHRALEVTSQAEIDVAVQIAAVKAALAVKEEARKAKLA